MKGRIRKIDAGTSRKKNFYLVDANFLANYALPHGPSATRRADEIARIRACADWWKRILEQTKRGRARVFVPEICIAEAFKVLAKKYYKEQWWANAAGFNASKRRLGTLVSTTHKQLQATGRKIQVHDVPATRDILVSVGRFHEAFLKAKPKSFNVQIADLILVSTAKFLMDFFDVPKDRLHIVTCDQPLLQAINKCVPELPNGYDPCHQRHSASKVFS